MRSAFYVDVNGALPSGAINQFEPYATPFPRRHDGADI